MHDIKGWSHRFSVRHHGSTPPSSHRRHCLTLSNCHIHNSVSTYSTGAGHCCAIYLPLSQPINWTHFGDFPNVTCPNSTAISNNTGMTSDRGYQYIIINILKTVVICTISGEFDDEEYMANYFYTLNNFTKMTIL